MTVFRDNSRAIGLLIMGVLCAGTAIALLLQEAYASDEFLLGIAFGGAAVSCSLGARQAVIADELGVRLRYSLRARFLHWEDIVCFKVTDVRNIFGEGSVKPAVLLSTGQAVPLPGANRFSWLRSGYSKSFPVVDQLEEYRRRVKGLS